LPYFVSRPNTLLSVVGWMLRRHDSSNDWRDATVDVIIPAFEAPNSRSVFEEEDMSIARYGVAHATRFVVTIALGGFLTAQAAAQTTQQPPTSTERSLVDPVTGKNRIDAKPSAPTPGASLPAPVNSSGKVGPGGNAIGQGAPSSPDGSAKIKDAAIERLGPGGTAAKASTPGLGPGGTAPPAPAGQSGRSEVVTPSRPATTGRQSGQAVAKGGAYVFIDPATGLITEPTEAQLHEAEAQNPTANLSFGEAVERPALVGGGMMADVPGSLFPVVTASVGTDGKVTFQESSEQLLSSDFQRNRPANEVHLELPPPTADVTVSIVNMDGAGEGFNDPTAVAPVFGNRGSTLGQQRLNVFRAAAEYWGGILRSTVPIQISAKLDPQFCNATSAVLGSAGPTSVFRDFGGAPLAATWYVQAVANSRASADQDPGNADINATFNSDVDNPICLGATSWWYGIGAPAPAGTIDFYTVVLHEIGHGIGVLSLVNLGTGAKLVGFDDAYERWLWDWTLGGWPTLTDAQRAASAVNTGQVIFSGPRATEAARGLQTAGNNAGYPRVFAPNPVQGGSSISHFDTVLTPNELMEPAITPPPGPYAFLTSGLLQDVGWQLLANGVFDFGGLGTWTWNPTDGWFSRTTGDPTDLEPLNGNFVGNYGASGTWLWNATTGGWSQLTTASSSVMKACRDNLLWASATWGTWRWNPSTGWQQLTNTTPDSLECLGGDLVWEGAAATWLYDFAGGVWSQLTVGDPVGILSCGSHLVWWRAGDTWYWDAATGWHYLTTGPQTTECYRGQLAWGGAAGTWLYNFTTSTWLQITVGNPEQMVAWGPNLVWENAAFGTWIYDGAAWTNIASTNPTHLEVLGADLLWSDSAGLWVWSGGGGGAAWTNINGAAPAEIVSTGAVK
jgi:hypothetical protein